MMSEEGTIDTGVLFLSHTLYSNKVSSHQCAAVAKTEATHVTPAPALLNECDKCQRKTQQINLHRI